MRKGIIYVYFNRAKYEKEGVEKYYVGQTIETMERRAGKDGKGYGIFDETCNSKFARSIRKWGWNAFEGRVLEEVDEEDLNELEKFYIECFDSYKNGYNTTLGGEGIRGHNPYSNKTEEEIEKIKKKMSKSQNKRFENEEEKEKLSKAQKKRFENEEEREKLSKIQNKRFENEEEKEKMSIIIKKRFEDPKIREKLSKSQKKRFENEEEREKLSKAQNKRFKNEEEREKISGEKNGNAKSVYCNTLNIIFSYIGLAEEYCKNVLNSKIGSISNICNGKGKYSGEYNGAKLTWSWTKKLDEEILNKAEFIDSEKYEKIVNERKKCGIPRELNYYATSVYCNELNIIFSYTKLAKKYCINILNSKIGLISDVCDGKTKSTGEYNGTKLTWSWTKNLDKEILNKAEFIDSEKYEKIVNERKKCSIPRELNYYATSVYCNELNILFSHIRLATEYCKNVLNIKIGRIDRTCNSKAKYSGKLSDGTKLTWSWTKNLDKEILDNAEYIDSKKYEEIINVKK